MGWYNFGKATNEKKNLYVKNLKLFEKEMNKLGYKIYLSFGTLLGAIRENDFIAHDDDIDIAYLSKYNNKKKANIEKYNIRNILLEKGMLEHEKDTLGTKVKYNNTYYDMYTSWIDGEWIYLNPFFKSKKKNII
ncbi:MAG: LicD family protein, partial [Atribacterota bacterium]